MKKNNEQQYKYIFDKVRTIINKYDPESLDPGRPDSNTPLDEYDAETARIVAFVLHNQEQIKLNPRLLSDEINKIWFENFDGICKSANDLARRIIRECM